MITQWCIPPDTVEPKHTVQPDGEPGKESACVRKGSVTCRSTGSLVTRMACAVTAVPLPVTAMAWDSVQVLWRTEAGS